jgi:hypothetical protein
MRVCAFLALACAGASQAFAQTPSASGDAPAPKRPTCATVINSTGYEYPVTFRADGQIIGTIRVPGGAKREVCLGKPARDPRLKVIVRSFWLEIGRCDIAIRGKVEIVRVKVEGEEITRIKCG